MALVMSRCLWFFIIVETLPGCFFVSKEELEALEGREEDSSDGSVDDTSGPPPDDTSGPPPDDSGDTGTAYSSWELDTGEPAASWELDAGEGPRYYGVTTGWDLTGDGWTDLALGETYLDGGSYTRGRVSLYAGPVESGGVVGDADVVLRSDDEFAMVGWGLDSAGDRTDDDSAVLIINAPTWTGDGSTGGGAAFVLVGPLEGVSIDVEDACAICVVAADEDWGGLKAHPAVSAGDVNGDGTEDLAMGWFRDPGTGYGVWDVYLFSDGGPDTTSEDATASTFGLDGWEEVQYDGNDEWLAGGRDPSGDGYDDLLVGKWFERTSPFGEIRLVEGSGDDLSTLFEDYTIVAEGDGVGEEGLGFVWGQAGDAGDLVYYTDAESGLYVYGVDQGTTQLLSVDTDAGQSAKLAGAGDVNSDGFVDITVSVQVGEDEACTAVLAGPLLDRTTVSLEDTDWLVNTSGEAGWVKLADLSADGVSDLLIVEHAGTSAWLYTGNLTP